MLCRAHVACLSAAGPGLQGLRGKEVGFYVGLSGQDQAWQLAAGRKRINRFSFIGASNASVVTRMSFIFGSNGPCMAIDTEDSSGAVALDTAVDALERNRC